MKFYQTEKILSGEELLEIRKTIDFWNEFNLWSDGMKSALSLHDQKIKKNLEMNDVNILNDFNNKIYNKLYNNSEFFNIVVPSGQYTSIISKMEKSGYYDPHIDNWGNGDYSTTVFLNDSDEYDGGELCFYFGGDEEVKIKMNAGWSVTYPTGILHRVNKVSSGTRYVSVIWSKSLLKDSFMRNIYYELSNIEDLIKNNYNNDVYVSDCISARRNPIFCIENLRNQILRNKSVY
jgi:PKHD-type hydroxylase